MFVKERGSNMKIVNKKKFIRSTSITISLIIFIILMLSNISFSHTENSYKEISIVSGDSLWSIARYERANNQYFENKDIRAVINELRNVNNFSGAELYEGEKIKIPIYK